MTICIDRSADFQQSGETTTGVPRSIGISVSFFIHDVTTGQRRVVLLPADLCHRLGISEGTPLRLIEHDSHFDVIPMRLVPATEGTSFALDSLLAGVTPENIHDEIDTGACRWPGVMVMPKVKTLL
jgi:hypothetical protein